MPPTSPDSDIETPERVVGKDIVSLWDETAPMFTRSRKNILTCRDIETGKELVSLPTTFSDEAEDAMVPTLPHRYLLPLKLTATLSHKRPRVKRLPIGQSLKAQKAADDLEAWLNAILEDVMDWKELIGRSIQDGEYAVVTLPNTADWVNTPDFFEEKTKTPKRRYWRDRLGKSPDDDEWQGQRDSKKTLAAYNEEVTDFLTRRLPFVVRIISATDCLPVFGPRHRLEGLLIRTLYSKQSLIRRKYKWINHKGELYTPNEASSDSQAMYGQKGQIFLYEYLGLDSDDMPYISYSVGGCDTWYAEDKEKTPAYIDLFETYGLTRLPVHYAYGMRYANDNPDERGVPFLWPLHRIILNIELNQASTSVYARRMAFPPYIEIPNPNSNEETLIEAAKHEVIDIPSGGGIIRSANEIRPLMPASSGNDIKWLVDLQMKLLEDSTQAESAVGGMSGQSGHAMTLSREYLEIANSMVLDGAKDAFVSTAITILEIAINLMKKHKTSIPVYRNVETPATYTRSSARSRSVIELKEEWVGPVYDVLAEYPKDSANIAEIQQAADLADRGFNTFDDVREKMGDPSPAMTRAKIFADGWFKTEQGMAEVAALAARLRGDDEKASQLELQSGSKITESGFPVDAVDPEAQMAADQAAASGMPPGAPGEMIMGPDGMPMAPGGAGMEQPPGPPPMAGVSQPNYAGSALGGIVAGAMESGARASDASAVAQAGGTPGTPM